MAKFRLKITGFIVLVLVTIIAVNIFWPAETVQLSESKDITQIRSRARDKSLAQTTLKQLEVKKAFDLSESKKLDLNKRENLHVWPGRLYQTGLLHREPDTFPDKSYKEMVESFRRMPLRYTRSARVDKRMELRQKVQRRYHRPSFATYKEDDFPYTKNSLTNEARESTSTPLQLYYKQFTDRDRRTGLEYQRNSHVNEAIKLMLMVSKRYHGEYDIIDKETTFQLAEGSRPSDETDLLQGTPKWRRSPHNLTN